MQTIYFISGLGADERVFQFLHLPNVQPVHIQWETPAHNEPLPHYCRRLIKQIDTTKPVTLIGLSFGGIIAREIAKIITVQKLIIISSIKTRHEMDWKLKFVSRTRAYMLAPAWFLKWSNKFTGNYYFGIKTKAESTLLKAIIKDTDPVFLKWAIARIMTWTNEDTDGLTLHIHGSADRIFPISAIHNATVIKGGGHFMVVNRAQEVAELIMQYM